MNLARLIYRNVTRNGFRSGVVFCSALLLAAVPFGVTFITEGGRASLQVVLSRLGADLLIVPEGAEIKVETALLMGKPAQAWMPRQNLAKIGRLPGVAQVSPQLHLATLAGASCCSAPEMFIVAYDPATDFTLRPWLDRQGGGTLGLDEVLGGSQVTVPNEKTNILVYGSPVRLKGNLTRSGTGLDQTLFMTFQTAYEIARMSSTRAAQELVVPTNQISAILLKLQPGIAPGDMVARIGREVSGVTALQSPELLRGTRRELTGLLRIIFVVLALVWLLSVAVTGLVFSLAAHERRRELGVLRALGSPRSVVFRLLLAEAVVLALAGAASGIALCLAIAFWFRDAIVFLLEMPFLFPPPALLAALVVGGLLVALLSVVLAAFVPAWRISRMEPASAMRE
jgi:putative ABC transport system permease protein